MKKIGILFVTIIMVVLFAVSANALESTGQCGENINWEFDSITGTLTLSGSGEMYDYSYAYDTPWYENGFAPYIKSAVVGEGITSLSGGAFWECYRMESVSLPESLKDLGLAAFANCCSLKEIELPDGLEKLGKCCFGACYGLTEVTVPEKIKEIPEECFSGCINLRTVNFPDGLEIIDKRAFEGCYVLTELTLGENVNFLGYQTFRICPILKDLHILNPDLDLTTYDTYVGKWVWLVDGYDRVEFFERYAEVYSELVIYIADHNVGVRDVEALEGEEKVRFESILGEYNEMTGKIENLQKYLGSSDNDCVMSTLITVHGCADSTAEAYAKAKNLKFEIIEKSTIVTDEKTKVEIEYADSVFENNIELIVSENAVNANTVFAEEYENYKSFDISLLSAGEKVQPNGKVTVKLPVPAGYNTKTIVVYYVDDNGSKTKHDSKLENGFVIFETDHFSEYVIVDESSKIEEPAVPSTPNEPDVPDEPSEPETPDTPSNPTDDCSCNCHKGGIVGFFFKIINFFQKLFGQNKICACGVKH